MLGLEDDEGVGSDAEEFDNFYDEFDPYVQRREINFSIQKPVSHLEEAKLDFLLSEPDEKNRDQREPLQADSHHYLNDSKKCLWILNSLLMHGIALNTRCN
mmetsp:Transcript_902/g.1107  ORF Transcript_902/g.1107 Transcript_902/m.1107 type:complete len:101 (-) Transcript_902:2712-3014(-)